MVFSPNCARIATAAAGEYTVRVWDIANAKLALPLLRHKRMISYIAFSPDGARLATTCEDGFLRVFDTSSGALIATPDHFAVTPGSLAFSPDGCLLASVAGDAFLWDTKTWRPKEPLRQGNALTSISFHPDSRMILAGAVDGTARLWDAQTGQPLSDLLQHGNRINRVQFSPDRLHFLTASEGGSARVWNIPFASSVAPDWLPPLAEAIAGLHLNKQKSPAKVGWVERENAFEIVAQLPPTNQLITALQSLIARSR
jgi:WD40 repeat protein